jgi:hypothetical protein
MSPSFERLFPVFSRQFLIASCITNSLFVRFGLNASDTCPFRQHEPAGGTAMTINRGILSSRADRQIGEIGRFAATPTAITVPIRSGSVVRRSWFYRVMRPGHDKKLVSAAASASMRRRAADFVIKRSVRTRGNPAHFGQAISFSDAELPQLSGNSLIRQVRTFGPRLAW